MIAGELDAAPVTKPATLPLKPNLRPAALSKCRAAAARNRPGKHTKRRRQNCRTNASGLLIAQYFHMRFAGERVGKAMSLRSHGRESSIVVAINAVIVANEPGLIGVLIQPGLQQTWGGVERQRNDLLSSQQIAYDNGGVARPGHHRQIDDAEWPSGYVAAHAHGIVDEQVNRRRQYCLSRNSGQRKVYKPRLRGKIGCPLHATKVHR